jgi:hypothetical protein
MGAALILHLPDSRPGATPPPLAACDVALIEFLRECARAAQLSEPLELHRVCPLAEDSARAYGRALLRALGAASARRMVFHPRRTQEVGFDERWLLRVLRALQSGDDASAAVLIAGRSARPGRRVLGWLARGLAERLSRDGVDAGAKDLDLRTIPSSSARALDVCHRRPA